jgi:uncharacterized protein (TIGR00297 family)
LSRLTSGELRRKLVHVGVGGFGFLLRFLSWPQAALMALGAFVFNWQVLPRIGGKRLWRGPDRERGYARGILLYPLSVLGLILFFHSDEDLWKVAAVWGVLAFGDGMASILGQALGGPRLPWNPDKGWLGTAAFLAFGTLGAGALVAWTLRLPLADALHSRILAIVLPLALVCALVEALPTTLDDNLTIPLVGGAFVALVAPVEWRPLLQEPELARRLWTGLGLNAAIAAAAFAARSIDLAGAVSAVVIGTAVTAGLGLPGLALLIAFFVVGSAVTRLGYRIKAARGIAQEKGGARGWRNAWANGGVPAFLALLAGACRAQAGPLSPAASEAGFAGLLLSVAYAASVATAGADTCSSEIGKAYGRRTFLITSFKPVPPGTEGAVSLEGTLGGLAGGAAVAAVGAAGGLYGWPVAVLVAIAGLLGSLAESVIGTLAEKRGWLDNDQLNALNTALGAGIAVLLVRLLQLVSPTLA